MTYNVFGGTMGHQTLLSFNFSNAYFLLNQGNQRFRTTPCCAMGL